LHKLTLKSRRGCHLTAAKQDHLGLLTAQSDAANLLALICVADNLLLADTTEERVEHTCTIANIV